MTFHFYEGKDFPAGNYATVEPNIENLKRICRNDEKCAGFATDGSLKRFIPHQLSQLVPMAAAKQSQGLYVKIHPSTLKDIDKLLIL